LCDRLAAPAAKVAQLLEDAEDDLLAFLDYPVEHRSKLRSTNPLERQPRDRPAQRRGRHLPQTMRA
jgi:transposase-like protein